MRQSLDVFVFLLASALLMLLFSMLDSEASEGKIIYTSKCVKCHNVNPAKQGSIGPDIANSSLELITLKTQQRKYPNNYTPKRKTKIMPMIKLTEKEIQFLHKYINSFNK